VIAHVAGHLTERHGCDGELQYLFVAPAFRRMGIARELLRMLAKWFETHQARKICVGVANDSAGVRYRRQTKEHTP